MRFVIWRLRLQTFLWGFFFSSCRQSTCRSLTGWVVVCSLSGDRSIILRAPPRIDGCPLCSLWLGELYLRADWRTFGFLTGERLLRRGEADFVIDWGFLRLFGKGDVFDFTTLPLFYFSSGDVYTVAPLHPFRCFTPDYTLSPLAFATTFLFYNGSSGLTQALAWFGLRACGDWHLFVSVFTSEGSLSVEQHSTIS